MTAPEDTIEGLKCQQHGTPTLLTCAQCDTPLCPKCAVWTEVGQKCATCSGRRATMGRSRAVPVLLAVLGVVVLGGGALYLASDAFQGSGDSDTTGTTVPGTPVGTIGEEVTQRGVTYKVSKLECGTGELGTGGARTTAAGKYCLLHLTVRNDGTFPIFLPNSQQFLVDASERRYTMDPAATIANAVQVDRQAVPSVLTAQLNPGTQIDRVYVYDVPAAAEPAEAELHATQAGGGGGIVRVPEREVRIRLTSST